MATIVLTVPTITNGTSFAINAIASGAITVNISIIINNMRNEHFFRTLNKHDHRLQF